MTDGRSHARVHVGDVSIVGGALMIGCLGAAGMAFNALRLRRCALEREQQTESIAACV